MIKFKLFGFFLLVLLITLSARAQKVSIDITPGSLSEKLAETKGDISELSLSGEADFRDLSAISECGKSIGTLDLTNLKIVSFSPSYIPGTENRSYNADELPDYIFFEAKISHLLLPQSIKKVNEGAFAESRLESVKCGNSLSQISDFAFYNCTKLKEISLNSNLTLLAKGVFQNCVALDKISLPASLSEIGESCFENTGLTEINIPAIATGKFAFANNLNLKKANLNRGKQIGDAILYGCPQLEEISGNPASIPALFAGMSTKAPAEDILSSTTSLGDFAFYGNATPEITIASSVNKIGKGSFGFMKSLKKIDVLSLNAIPETDSLAFVNIIPKNVILLVSDGMKGEWEEAYPWSLFNIMTEDELTKVAEVDSDNPLKVFCDGNMLKISSIENWNQLLIYSSSGIILKAAASGNLLEIPIDEFSRHNILVISARFGNELKTVKIII